MNYQTVVDEVTSLLSPLLSPRHVSASVLSFKGDEEEGGKKKRRRTSRGVEGVERTEEGKKGQARVRGQNIEEVMEKRRVKSCRGQMTGGVGGYTEGRRKRRRVKANVASAV